jgi:hypothetical protein
MAVPGDRDNPSRQGKRFSQVLEMFDEPQPQVLRYVVGIALIRRVPANDG